MRAVRQGRTTNKWPPDLGLPHLQPAAHPRLLHHTKTRAAAVSIGERRKPDPRGRPGYWRVARNTETSKGLYHINAVDTVTQWPEAISGRPIWPVLEAKRFFIPTTARSFSTTGWRGCWTEGRRVHQMDSAVAADRITNGIGKLMHAEKLQRFYTADFNAYLNYHRPCGFATVETASNGKRRRRYRLETGGRPAKSCFRSTRHLKPGITVAFLQQQARRMVTEYPCACSNARENCSTPDGALSWVALGRTGRSGTRQGGTRKGKLKKPLGSCQARAQLPPPP